jgi:crotonobetainyl-CoA:carnitine CoA-transferase CaiB-like acyl-CoA transferase
MDGLPLAGLRILSFEQFGAGPYATMFLADLGAEVLKVESPEGDYARRTGPQTLGANDSLYYQSMNLNKKSLVIDLKDPDDRAAFDDLVATADAVVNNLRGSLPKRLGLDYAGLKAINPKVVCGHISAYGRNNSRADRPGYDFLMQAEAGLMELTGEPGSVPTRVGVSMIDYMTGMMMAFGLVSAIRGAALSGVGCDVDVSLFDAALHQLCYQGVWYLNERLVTRKTPRSSHPSLTPVQLFKTADGWVYIAAMTDKFWQLLLKELGCEEMGDDPRFRDSDARLLYRDTLTELLDDAFGKRTTADWVDRFSGTVPVAPVYDLEQALNNPYLSEAEMVNEVDHPKAGAIRVFSNPLRLNGERLAQRAAPALGEHTAELKAERGARQTGRTRG